MLSNSPGNIGFEASPFKLPLEYIEVLGGMESDAYREFRVLFKEGFEAARKHCDRIISEHISYPAMYCTDLSLHSTRRTYAERSASQPVI